MYARSVIARRRRFALVLDEPELDRGARVDATMRPRRAELHAPRRVARCGASLERTSRETESSGGFLDRELVVIRHAADSGVDCGPRHEVRFVQSTGLDAPSRS